MPKIEKTDHFADAGKKAGCYGCVHADWDANGCTCRLDGLNVWNASKGCKYRKEKAVTNGDKIRSMSNGEIALFLYNAGIESCSYGITPLDWWLKWLEREVDTT